MLENQVDQLTCTICGKNGFKSAQALYGHIGAAHKCRVKKTVQDVIPLKFCHRCGEAKELSAFNKASVTKDGLQSWCRECQRINMEQWIQARKVLLQRKVEPLQKSGAQSLLEKEQQDTNGLAHNFQELVVMVAKELDTERKILNKELSEVIHCSYERNEECNTLRNAVVDLRHQLSEAATQLKKLQGENQKSTSWVLRLLNGGR